MFHSRTTRSIAGALPLALALLLPDLALGFTLPLLVAIVLPALLTAAALRFYAPGLLVFSLAKRWLLGTHAGAVKPQHLQAYLD